MTNWKDIPGYEGMYQANKCGGIRSLNRDMVDSVGRKRYFPGKTLAGKITSNGYRRITLCKDGVEFSYFEHGLIMLTFVGPRPDGYDTHHINGIRTDNRISNLKYLTKGQHAMTWENSPGRKGEKHSQAKLDKKTVTSIRNRKKNGERTGALAKEYCVSPSTICDIFSGRSWSHIKGE